MWHQLADTLVTSSTCASLQGQLLALGGKDSDDKETTAIHMYNTTTNSWEVISHMATLCMTSLIPRRKVNPLLLTWVRGYSLTSCQMVVGGGAPEGETDSVDLELLSLFDLFCVPTVTIFTIGPLLFSNHRCRNPGGGGALGACALTQVPCPLYMSCTTN